MSIAESDGGTSELDSLPDYAPGDVDERVDLDAVYDYGNHEAEDSGVDDFASSPAMADTEDDDQGTVMQAINPPGTVAVTAYLNGSVAQVDLDPRVTTLTESQLADEIRFVAAVAAAKATAVVHVGVVDMMVEQGVDLGEATNFVAANMPFATPQQAADAELALIARHSERED
ncbi:hypothetical protein [Mycobacterium sp. DBP42]|uniref:hypothetical protein n=1 Tax=Mycobacterium sp. DBP42 TaxID=2545267 RepID=UPI0020177692|nr:hypothetical protein [Mycobacterium sp. DBP42]